MLRFLRFPSRSTATPTIVQQFSTFSFSHHHNQFRFHSSPPSSNQQPSAATTLSPIFLRTLQGILYRLSTTTSSLSPAERRPTPASPSRPRWVPLGVLGGKLPEDLVESELDNYNGGLRAVLTDTPLLKQTCELARDHLTGMWNARVKPLVASPTGDEIVDAQSAGDTDRLAKLASIVTSQLLNCFYQRQREEANKNKNGNDDDGNNHDANLADSVFVSVSTIENILDPPILTKLLEKYQHLNIALVEAERWIPEANLCWTLQLREVNKNSNWQQSVIGLKQTPTCKASLDVLIAMKEAVAEFAVPEPQFFFSTTPASTQQPPMSNQNNNLNNDVMADANSSNNNINNIQTDINGNVIGDVPAAPPPPPVGNFCYSETTDPTSSHLQQQQEHNEEFEFIKYNFGRSSGNNAAFRHDQQKQQQMEFDMSLIPPAPTQEQINDIYQKAQYDATIESGQTYIPANPTTSDTLQGIALKVEDLMHFIPSFFIPIELALEQLAPLGYTQEHIDNYFSNIRSVQIIKSAWPSSSSKIEESDCAINGDGEENSSPSTSSRQFIRIFAGGGKFDMGPILETNKRFARFEPLPSLSRPFLKILSKPGVWMTVRELLDLTGKEAEDALPYKGNDALLYFAQLQHIFVFSVERGGIVARRPQSQNFSLFSSTTPCPVFYNQLCRVMERQMGGSNSRIAVDAIPQLLLSTTVGASTSNNDASSTTSSPLLEEMQRCFPNWIAFAAAHREKFTFDPARSELMFTSAFEAAQRKEMGLDDQLEYAMRSKNFSSVKALKRRIAASRNPDNPLLDPERLAAAVTEFLPVASHIKVSSLLRSLPDEIRDLLPKAGLQRFIKRFPIYFTAFDYRLAGVRHVQRAGLQLPSGALRSDFSKEEIVSLCVQELQRKGGRVNVANLLLKMPGSVIEQLKRGANLAGILKEYSDCFVFVSSGGSVDVILVKPPPFVAGGIEAEGDAAEQSNNNQQNYNDPAMVTSQVGEDFGASAYENDNYDNNNNNNNNNSYKNNNMRNRNNGGGFRPPQQGNNNNNYRNNNNNNHNSRHNNYQNQKQQPQQPEEDEWVTMAKESFGL